MPGAGSADTIRLDKLLWFLRFARSRSLAQAIVASGHVRLDGRRVLRASTAVRAGQVLVMPIGERIEVIRINMLPGRRGPAPEARTCYIRLEPQSTGETLGEAGASFQPEE